MKPRVWGDEPTPDTQTTRGYPPDVHRDSSSRLPPVRREDLDEAGQCAYDAMTKEGSKLRASLRGPTGCSERGVECLRVARDKFLPIDNGVE